VLRRLLHGCVAYLPFEGVEHEFPSGARMTIVSIKFESGVTKFPMHFLTLGTARLVTAQVQQPMSESTCPTLGCPEEVLV
jgi:hypothetical protein